MSNDRMMIPRDFDLRFSFISYGVTVGLASDDPVLLDKARGLVAKAFGDRAEIFEDRTAEIGRTFGIAEKGGLFRLYKNGIEISSGPSERNFFKYLNSMLRLEVAEFSEGRVFLHAGVVGWKGRAIIFPATSFAGKSTLTAELVRNGADYYSDEYAVLEKNGCVSPFPRHLSLRYFGATIERDVPPEELGGRTGRTAIPVGMVLLTSFSKGAKWRPEILTAGSGIMELIPNTLTMHRDPAFALKVLDLVARRAIIVKSPRGDVKKFAKFLLAFFDKHTKLAKMT
jgi:hypothetical protein